MGDVIEFAPGDDLSPEQKEYWWAQLEIAERKVQYAQRMLGILIIKENGVTDV